jgi:hypothetical protein
MVLTMPRTSSSRSRRERPLLRSRRGSRRRHRTTDRPEGKLRSSLAGVVGGALGQRDHVGYTLLGIRLIQSRARGDNLRHIGPVCGSKVATTAEARGEEAIKLIARGHNVTGAWGGSGVCAQQRIHETGHGPSRLSCRRSGSLAESGRRAAHELAAEASTAALRTVAKAQARKPCAVSRKQTSWVWTPTHLVRKRPAR